MTPSVRISWGELIDKITILEIKAERLASETARVNVVRELSELMAIAAPIEQANPAMQSLKASLKQVNERLWQIEDDIRQKEAAKSFDAGFVELARAVYHNNDERGRIKAQINILLKSEIIEEKQYALYR